MIRFSAKGVPAKRTAFGKNSSIDGGWKSAGPAVSAKIPAATRMAARTASAALRMSRAEESG
ncbi:hypothetical protein [Pseudolysinimonas kribbensis]|uniref:hypothetical protein n=1 Tax=Pseudolysinimonas kribbensis TaxID=433641 RepID=UPI0024E0A2AF|nr:hypothetical protein [Pseudolysinimonas kribbensis]